ncbi:hypothetical protein H477_3345 [[Clostridium] sordellii ATCC 9714]|nr:hypothetical protein H477_3345 [[Clostridium] sordellii ATCC 9714] [Paeniclostridium sordellii ATCC 9714]
MDKENKKKSINKNIVIFAAVLILGVGTAFYMGKQKGRTLPATSRHYSSNKV